MQSVSAKDILNGVREDQRSQVEHILDEVFGSLRWAKVSGGQVEEITHLESWKHRSASEIEADLAYLEINRASVLSALSEYLSNDSIASAQLDWLFLNLLTYAEYNATLSEVRKSLMGIDRYIKSLLPPKTTHITDISVFTKRLWHIPVSLTFVGIAWLVHPALGAIVVAYLLYIMYKKRKVVEKLNATLMGMLQTYLSFNTTDVSWSQVASMLEKSRDSGAIWDASIFALIEKRKASNKVL